MAILSRYHCAPLVALAWLMLIASTSLSGRAQTSTTAGGLPGTATTALTNDPTAIDRPRVVLLKNDRCLTGIVRTLGDQIVIEIDADARISKPASEVVFIADDLEGIYRYKLQKFQRLGPGENIRLARWALTNGLNEAAARHFLAVHREAADHPLVKQLGVELREQLLRDEGFRHYLGLAPLPSDPAAPAVEVRTASTVDSAPQPILPAVVASFSEHVQPILLKRCSQSGCHGLSATNRLKLIQPVGNARGRISEQNCRSALQFIEVDNSNMSELVRYAIAAHGIQKSPAISAQEPRLLESLQSWTTFARNPVMAAVEQSSSRSAAAGSPATPPASGAAPAVYNGQARPGKYAAPATLAPLPPGASQLPAAAPPGNASGSVTDRELDRLDDLVRRALGEPPRTTASPSPTSPQPAGGASVSPASATAGSKAGSESSGIPGTTDPFDPAEFNRRAAAKQMDTSNSGSKQ